MSDATAEPGENAGINALRLDADRTRDELEKTLDEIERELDPRRIPEKISREWEVNPGRVILVAVGVVGAIAGLIWLVAANGSRSST